MELGRGLVGDDEGYDNGYCLWQWVLYDGPLMTVDTTHGNKHAKRSKLTDGSGNLRSESCSGPTWSSGRTTSRRP